MQFMADCPRCNKGAPPGMQSCPVTGKKPNELWTVEQVGKLFTEFPTWPIGAPNCGLPRLCTCPEGIKANTLLPAAGSAEDATKSGENKSVTPAPPCEPLPVFNISASCITAAVLTSSAAKIAARPADAKPTQIALISGRPTAPEAYAAAPKLCTPVHTLPAAEAADPAKKAAAGEETLVAVELFVTAESVVAIKLVAASEPRGAIVPFVAEERSVAVQLYTTTEPVVKVQLEAVPEPGAAQELRVSVHLLVALEIVVKVKLVAAAEPPAVAQPIAAKKPAAAGKLLAAEDESQNVEKHAAILGSAIESREKPSRTEEPAPQGVISETASTIAGSGDSAGVMELQPPQACNATENPPGTQKAVLLAASPAPGAAIPHNKKQDMSAQAQISPQPGQQPQPRKTSQPHTVSQERTQASKVQTQAQGCQPAFATAASTKAAVVKAARALKHGAKKALKAVVKAAKAAARAARAAATCVRTHGGARSL